MNTGGAWIEVNVHYPGCREDNLEHVGLQGVQGVPGHDVKDELDRRHQQRAAHCPLLGGHPVTRPQEQEVSLHIA